MQDSLVLTQDLDDALPRIGAQKAAAFRAGARAVFLPGLLAGTVLTPLLMGWGLPTLTALLKASLPDFLAVPLFAMALLSVPLVAVLPAALAARSETARRSSEDPSLGRAAGAGAGLMATSLASGWILASSMATGSAALAVCFLPFALVAASAVGGSAFLGLADSKDSPEKGIPAVYQSMATLGVTSCLAVFSVCALEWVIHSLPPLAAMSRSLRSTLPGLWGVGLKNMTQLLLLLPLTFMAARWSRRRLPKVPGWVLGLGLLAPAVFPLVILFGHYLSFPGFPAELFVLSAGVIAGTLPHLGALGLGRHLEGRRLESLAAAPTPGSLPAS